MAKKGASIRISAKDKEEYSKLRKNSLSKIRRINNKHGLDVSKEVPLPKLEEFKTRSDYNQWKQTAKSFTNRYNPNFQFKENAKGVPISKAEITKGRRATEKAQRLADKTKANLRQQDAMAYGEKIGKLGQQMDVSGRPIVPAISRPKDFDPDSIGSREDLKKVLESREKRANPETFKLRNKTMKDTFIRELEENFNTDADKALDLLKNMNPDHFYFLYLKHTEFDYQLFYPIAGVDDSHQQKQLRAIEKVMENYWEGNENMDLMGF